MFMLFVYFWYAIYRDAATVLLSVTFISL